MRIIVNSLLLMFITNRVECAFPNLYDTFETLPPQENVNDDPGLPLILTPLIKQNKIKQAVTAAQVHFNGFKNQLSYSGYFTVNEQYNSNMFFWYFPAQTDAANAPVLLWLQGGPGATSLIGLFAENGPFKVKSKHGLKLRPYSWTKTHSVIYIDNPVGTGYSFTKQGGYCRDEICVGQNLYEALQQFFTMFPDLQKNDFFVTGESYAGKYVPAISYTILQKNPTAALKINLKGLAIGNGLSDPVNQLKYGDYLYQIGLIDSNTRALVQQYEQQGIKYIQNKDYISAFKIFDALVNGDTNNHTSLFKNVTGFDNYFNYLYTTTPNDQLNYMIKYIQRNDIRAALHVGNTSFIVENQVVELNLVADIMQSVAPWISQLLSNYRVLIYNGQLDIIVAYPLTVNYLQNLQFSGADQYKRAPRYKWYVGTDLAGYFKQAGNLTEVLVRNAGHMVPQDQPKWAFDMISRFTRNKSFYKKP